MDEQFIDLIEDSVPIGHRRAALVLATLSEADRQWILNQLEAFERQWLMPLIEEVSQFKIPQTFTGHPMGLNDFIEELLVDRGPSSSGSSALEQRLQVARAEDIVAFLAGEPAELCEAFLSARTWPWHDQVLDLLPRHQRELIESNLSTQAYSAAWVETLLAVASERLETLKPTHSGQYDVSHC